MTPLAVQIVGIHKPQHLSGADFEPRVVQVADKNSGKLVQAAKLEQERVRAELDRTGRHQRAGVQRGLEKIA
jgi:hypothetical protein